MPKSKINVKRTKHLAENVENAANALMEKQVSLKQARAYKMHYGFSTIELRK